MSQPLKNEGFTGDPASLSDVRAFPVPHSVNAQANAQESDPVSQETEFRDEDWFSASQIVQLLSLSSNQRRSISNWIAPILEAYCWIDLSELKQGEGAATRYRGKCVRAMQSLMSATGSGQRQTYDQWIAAVHAENQERYDEWLLSQSATLTPEVMATEPLGGALLPCVGGQVALQNQAVGVQPLVYLQIENVNVTVQQADTSGLNHQTQQLQSTTQQSALALNDLLVGNFRSGVKTVVAQSDHLLAAIQANMVATAVQDLGGKPQPQAATEGKPPEPAPGGQS